MSGGEADKLARLAADLAAKTAEFQVLQRASSEMNSTLELDEIYELSDRILTIYEGRITGEFSPDTPPDKLGLAMTGKARKEEAA